MIDVASWQRELRVDAFAAATPPSWLLESWRDPARLVDELCAWQGARGAAPSSIAGGGHHLFHDLVRRHAAGAVALVWYEAGARRELSYGELAAAAAARAAAWRRAGAAAGQRVAIVRAFGPELVVSLLAALDLGLVLSLVPPAGRRLAQAQLLALAPELVDLDALHAALVPADARRLPAAIRGDGADEPAHTYRPDEPVALLFDPAAPALDEPRPLGAGALFAGALIDGALVLGLAPGDVVAAPELPLLATQPALVCAVLMSGATFLHLTLDDVARAPERLAAQPLAAVGVSAALRTLLVQRAPALAGRWASWFRDPLELPPLQPWQEMIAACDLGATPAMNLRWEAALGGCTLFSCRRVGRAHFDVLPAPARAWSLVDLAQPEKPATGPGRLAIATAPDARAVTAAVVIPSGGGWMSGGAMPSHPRGRVYPDELAIAVARGVDGCRAATLLVEPSGDGAAPRAILVLFAGGNGDSERVRQAAWLALTVELGGELLPDDVVCFPLLPRRDDAGALDTRWCRQQLRDGGLLRKANDELFRLLSSLRERVAPISEEPV